MQLRDRRCLLAQRCRYVGSLAIWLQSVCNMALYLQDSAAAAASDITEAL